MVIDTLIKGGRIVDGSGNPWYNGDIAVTVNEIACIARNIEPETEKVIDATGLVVAPGFIDAHSHADSSTLFYREMENAVAQGITTVVAGQCGSSIAPVNPDLREELEKRLAGWLPPEVEFGITWTTFEEYLREEEKEGLGANVAHLVGHGAVRIASMGFEARAPTTGELEVMKGHVAEAMNAGAYGLSTGLIYPPGIFAETPEILELAKVAARHGGIYDSHIRGEGKTLMESLGEAITIGRVADIPVQISHHKAATKSLWGKSIDTLSLLEKTRLEGVDITVDQYPYVAGSTSLATPRRKPHPRGYGTYPKILGRYVKESGTLTLEEGIRKMTSFPAQRFGLYDRGLLKPGMAADIVVFNPDTVMDTATYKEPHRLPNGIEYVIVGGELTVESSKPLGTLAGRTLRKNM